MVIPCRLLLTVFRAPPLGEKRCINYAPTCKNPPTTILTAEEEVNYVREGTNIFLGPKPQVDKVAGPVPPTPTEPTTPAVLLVNGLAIRTGLSSVKEVAITTSRLRTRR